MDGFEFSWPVTNPSTNSNDNSNNQISSELITVISSILIDLKQFIKLIFNPIKTYTKETVEHLIVTLIFYILLCIILYLAFIKWKLIGYNNQIKDVKRALIIIAHPDDECMFFGPTIFNLLKANSRLYLMCLSTGRNYGMGSVRKNELYKSCKVLGINDSCITVYDHTDLPDRIDCKWPIDTVSQLILNQIECYNIDTLITFDKYGVSRHLNHCSIYYAIAYLSLEKKLPEDCRVYVLETVNLLRKYWLILDLPLTYILSRIRYTLSFNERQLIHNAMKEHRSQLVWYRFLYMYLTRYMLINSLQRMDISDIELDLELDD